MELVVAPRQGGKTTHLLEWARGAPEGVVRIIVFPTAWEAMELYRSTFDAFGRSDLASWQFISWEDAIENPLAHIGKRGRIELAIDNVDLLLQGLLRRSPGQLTLATMTIPDTWREPWMRYE